MLLRNILSKDVSNFQVKKSLLAQLLIFLITIGTGMVNVIQTFKLLYRQHARNKFSIMVMEEMCPTHIAQRINQYTHVKSNVCPHACLLIS